MIERESESEIRVYKCFCGIKFLKREGEEEERSVTLSEGHGFVLTWRYIRRWMKTLFPFLFFSSSILTDEIS